MIFMIPLRTRFVAGAVRVEHHQHHILALTFMQDVAEALRRLPPDVIVARNCRLRRAADLDLKHDHLHGELLSKQTPGESYLQVSRCFAITP